MRVISLAVATAALWNASSAIAANKFDLVCKGTSELTQAGAHTSEPFEQILHIDLERNQYCIGNCAKILDLARADPLKITLVDIPRHGGITDLRMEKWEIDRQTGDYSIFDFDAAKLHTLSVKAICNPTAFTPFPATKF